ncbi:3-deoxy-8-phosphooctulonate synthase [bacterium]|nr:3-deoxy-8-phosphooctulonate synthase [bacterium]
MKNIDINGIKIGPGQPLALIAGPCVIETEKIAFETAETIQHITTELGIPYIYKSSYTKANRQSVTSYTGPGLKKGLKILAEIKSRFNVPILTDIHNAAEAQPVAEVADILQIPAFLCRQTDLVVAAAKTGKPLSIKKGQFMAPEDMATIARKAESVGNTQVMLVERGTTFGYHNLVVDFRALPIMHKSGYPVIFDATHSLQLPGAGGTHSGGQPEFIFPMARAAVAAGCEALFIETHPCVEKALCDGANMLPLEKLKALLVQLKKINELVRSF